MLLQQQLPTVVFPQPKVLCPHTCHCAFHVRMEPKNMNSTMCGSVHSVSCDDFYMGIKSRITHHSQVVHNQSCRLKGDYTVPMYSD